MNFLSKKEIKGKKIKDVVSAHGITVIIFDDGSCFSKDTTELGLLSMFTSKELFDLNIIKNEEFENIENRNKELFIKQEIRSITNEIESLRKEIIMNRKKIQNLEFKANRLESIYIEHHNFDEIKGKVSEILSTNY